MARARGFRLRADIRVPQGPAAVATASVTIGAHAGSGLQRPAGVCPGRPLRLALACCGSGYSSQLQQSLASLLRLPPRRPCSHAASQLPHRRVIAWCPMAMQRRACSNATKRYAVTAHGRPPVGAPSSTSTSKAIRCSLMRDASASHHSAPWPEPRPAGFIRARHFTLSNSSHHSQCRAACTMSEVTVSAVGTASDKTPMTAPPLGKFAA